MTSQSLGRVSILLKGEYSSTTQYVRLDIVSYEGSSYCALDTTQGNLPTDVNHWQKIAEKGETGNTGATGATGPQGATGNGITTVELLETSGATDTYRMSFSNGDYFDFDVVNGDGSDWSDLRNKPFETISTSFFLSFGGELQLSSSVQAQLNSIANKANSSDVYTKAETNSKISGDISTFNTNTVQPINSALSDLEDDVDEINNRLSASVGGTNSNGDAWVSGKAYVVGDMVIYNNKLYYCKTAHTSVSTFTSANWEESSLSKVTDELSVSSGSLTALNSCTFNKNILKKQGNVVYMDIDISKTSGLASQLATVPSGFRPSATARAFCLLVNSSWGTKYCQVAIRTDGIVQVEYPTSAEIGSYTTARISITYII